MSTAAVQREFAESRDFFSFFAGLEKSKKLHTLLKSSIVLIVLWGVKAKAKQGAAMYSKQAILLLGIYTKVVRPRNDYFAQALD